MARTLVKTIDIAQIENDISTNSDNILIVMPVGSVVHSMLTEAQFQAENGFGWVLARGQSVVGSRYQTITGSPNAPDLRGVFLRGKNNGRSTSSGNASADRALGTYEGDAIRNITGGTNRNETAGTGYSGTGYGAVVATDFATKFQSSGLTPSMGRAWNFDASRVVPTAAENRPRNVTVNIFIKIN
jgi:hypothetical protein